MKHDGAEQQQRSLALALQRAQLGVEQLWLRYFAIGGSAGLWEVDAYVHGLGALETLQRDVLAQAVNERLDELTWSHRATYSRRLRESAPRGQMLTALVSLLESAELAPPERLPVLLEAAGQALNVRIRMYLIDYDQRFLRPVGTGRASENAGSDGLLDVDATLAGRAFRQVRILPQATPRPRLWVPLLDGVERLGVLEVEVIDAEERYDPALRTQCRWLAMLVGHLVTIMDQYGHALDQIRLPAARTVGSELIWSLLPPLTAGVDSFVVSAVVEPRHSNSGDAFDYDLTERTARLLVVDAVGHDLRSGLIAATALAAYRSARHAGHGLYEQARVMDVAIRDQFGPGAFATAVVAEVDLPTGRLRYINAGHPEPLIMRSGKIVKPLRSGRRRPLGIGQGELTVGEEALQPDDWLILYTDGITEARDPNGEFFGEGRLVDFLRREAASGHPPPETARRLIRAVLAHQHGIFQDDATVLLARWSNPASMIGDRRSG
ncbi:serine/threonine-protein phosphatase [Nocardia sp. CDC159]|uniref:Serine/threonine-protein phosphatase n=1 Tax=Nocardia pulmonis TaxID=2951408 RepID=A0A9X2E2P4_9NOCA|nr:MULTISPECIES: PP2C family protein-serine/threonine phosphatase [Nocardia]MCM6773159.1 serine/threonine-protein phosphatase [Nocardia pulmonis]MCM6785538.1 serine/threonine-protein phosphatase [Nocardia sp. CDC159]